jgi:hypothetical protein
MLAAPGSGVAESIFRRSGNRFAAENAITREQLEHDPFLFERIMLQ